MIYHLDTNICSALMANDPIVCGRLSALDPAQLAISSVVLAELRFGVEKSPNRAKHELALGNLLDLVGVEPFDRSAAYFYGLIRARMESQGKLAGPNDMLIAATALSRNATLYTRNYREFARVPELRVELI